jgi:hypothetical protein
MTKLRCWPGALAVILRGELKGKTIECDAVSYRPDGRAQWSYKGDRLYAYVDGKLWECGDIADDNLRPITPPPTDKVHEEPITQLTPEDATT